MFTCSFDPSLYSDLFNEYYMFCNTSVVLMNVIFNLATSILIVQRFPFSIPVPTLSVIFMFYSVQFFPDFFKCNSLTLLYPFFLPLQLFVSIPFVYMLSFIISNHLLIDCVANFLTLICLKFSSFVSRGNSVIL